MFLSKPFGLDISNYSAKVIALKGSFEKPKLLAMGEVLFEPGILEESKVLKKQAFKRALRHLVKKPRFGKITTKHFIFSLPEHKTFIANFAIPENLSKKALPDFIRQQAEENFPYSLKDLYFDYRLRGKEGFLAAAPKELVDDYLEVFQDCQLKPTAFEIESISLGRALFDETNEVVLVVDIGGEVTNLNIFEAGKLRFSDSLPFGGNKFTRALADKLVLSLSEAEAVKKRAGFNPKAKKGRVFLVLQKEIQSIIEEIGRARAYFREDSGQDVEKILLGGGSSALPHLAEYLRENVNISLEVYDPWGKINIVLLKEKKYFAEALKINPLIYAVAIGGALRGLIKNPSKANINLLPKGR